MTGGGSGMLEGLLAQAESEGARRVTLRAIVEEASALGAQRALLLVGLDAGAGTDMVQLRQLIQGWRDAKKSAVSGAVSALFSGLVRMLVAALLLGIAWKSGLMSGGGGG